MTNDSLLVKRATDEYINYIEEVKQMPPEKIVDEAYKISTFNDILMLIENNSLDEEDLTTLLSLDNPIHSIYAEWLDNDSSISDYLKDTIRDVINLRQADLEESADNDQQENGGIDDDSEMEQ